MHPKDLRIDDFDYLLPESRIANYPLHERDASKLLVCQQGQFSQDVFHHITQYLNKGHLVISNNTRVIPARLFFKKATGGVIEIFCLEPEAISHQDAMTKRGQASWWCMVGGAKKWKGDEKLTLTISNANDSIALHASKLKQENEKFLITFSWSDSITFSEILEKVGCLPLPPYIQRDAEQLDYERYQTIFAAHKGSVAAPTAGLHFTPSLIARLKQQQVGFDEITLHVGAGTFRPVSTDTISGHSMHREAFSVSVSLLEKIVDNTDRKIVAVGTTTMRTLESLYYIGASLLNGNFVSKLHLDQWAPYEATYTASTNDALRALIDWAKQRGLSHIEASTAIIIAPGYRFRICKGLVTNFHLPKSTLLLLVAAFLSQEGKHSTQLWKELYQYALENDFRFLSYGDSSLLLP